MDTALLHFTGISQRQNSCRKIICRQQMFRSRRNVPAFHENQRHTADFKKCSSLLYFHTGWLNGWQFLNIRFWRDAIFLALLWSEKFENQTLTNARYYMSSIAAWMYTRTPLQRVLGLSRGKSDRSVALKTHHSVCQVAYILPPK